MNQRLVTGIIALSIITGCSAYAADLRVGATPPPSAVPIVPLAVWSWTGWYIGANLGGAFESTDVDDNLLGFVPSTILKDSFPASVHTHSSGFIGGGQIGYNWQFAPMWVVGTEATFDGASLRSSGVSDDSLMRLRADSKINSVITLAGRFGFAANNWLFYGKGGAAWVHESLTLTDLFDSDNNFPSASFSDTRTGWLAGAGIEYGITRNWSVRVDWSHIGLDNQKEIGPVIFFAPGLFGPDAANISRHLDIVTAGVNYRF